VSGVKERTPALACAALAAAIAVQVWDHFSRVGALADLLSVLTLITGSAQLLILHRDRSRAVARATAAESLRSASTEAALDCVITIDAEGRVRDWNEAASRTFGHRASDALGRELAELIIPPESRAQHRRGLDRMADQGGSGRILNRRIEVMAMNSAGGRIPVELAVTQVQADPPMFTGFLRNISDRRRSEEENGRLAAIVRSSDNAILVKDLKGIVTAWNQGAERLYGFSAEEALGMALVDLIVPADRQEELDQVTRNVLAGEPTSFETRRRRKDGQMLDVSLRAFPVRDLEGQIVGISTSGHDISERRHREEQDRRDREGRLWRARITTALRESRFLFLGQPVVDVRTGATDHHELLIRMSLNGETITPNHFLPHAEEGDLITQIDQWAVRAGIGFARDAPVAINLSAKSLRDDQVIAIIEEELTDRALAQRVIFEITETAVVEDLEATSELVNRLRALGCGVALDDFGTGYGSFTYLKHLAITELKIDLQFIRGLADEPADRRMVTSIIDVAKNFGLKTVAEGVEDEATWHLLDGLGVDLVQGYYVGYPSRVTPESVARASGDIVLRAEGPRVRPRVPRPALASGTASPASTEAGRRV
jgi:PAS domain S-box-containing protein